MRIGIVGSRNFTYYDCLKRELDAQRVFDKDFELVSGGADGADSLAYKYAKENGLKITTFFPDWNKLGKKAGFIRNKLIVDNSDIVVAFSIDHSKGTELSIELARKAGKKLIIYRWDK